MPYCEVETKKLPSVLLNDGDIVFARTGATTGKSFLVENPVDSVFASYLIRVSIDKKVFLPKYVMHYFQSAAYWQQVNEGISGAAQGGRRRLEKIEKQISQVMQSLDAALSEYAKLRSALLAQELQTPQSEAA